MARSQPHLTFLSALAAIVLAVAACEQTGDSRSPLPADSTAAALTSTAASTSPAEESRAATPSPVAGATIASPAGVERDGPDGLKAFAGTVQAAFDHHDTAFFIQHMKGTTATCTAADLNRRGPEGRPLCASVGATYRGFLAGRWRSEWETVPLEEAFQTLTEIIETAEPSAQDMLGNGRLRIDSLNVAPGDYRIIATAIALRPLNDPRVGPKRVSLSLTAVFESDRWLFTSLLTAPVLAEDLVTPGTEFTSRLTAWERYRP